MHWCSRKASVEFFSVLILFYFVLYPGWSAAVLPVPIQKSGPSENRVDVVFLAEGFTAAERDKFLAEVRKVTTKWMSSEPWKSIFRMINIYAVPLESQDSGIDHPSQGIMKNTALDGGFDCAGVDRLICVDKIKALREASVAVPLYDEVVVMVNDGTYGGAGGFVSVFSLHRSSLELFFHEFGHTFGHLADEYSYAGSGNPPDVEPTEVNVTKQKSRSKIKWLPWILPETPIPTPVTEIGVIGLFRGAYYHPTKFSRPKLNCKMRNLDIPFCEVCGEAHILRMYSETSLVDTSKPDVDVVLPRSRSQIFSIKLAPVTRARLLLEWRVDGRVQPGKTGIKLRLFGNQLSAGTHHVEFRIKDTTTLVKNDKQNLLTTSVIWNVEVQ